MKNGPVFGPPCMSEVSIVMTFGGSWYVVTSYFVAYFRTSLTTKAAAYKYAMNAATCRSMSGAGIQRKIYSGKQVSGLRQVYALSGGARCQKSRRRPAKPRKALRGSGCRKQAYTFGYIFVLPGSRRRYPRLPAPAQRPLLLLQNGLSTRTPPTCASTLSSAAADCCPHHHCTNSPRCLFHGSSQTHSGTSD